MKGPGAVQGKTAYIVADLEGSTGAWTKAHTLLGTPQWQQARVELTLDINAVAGALLETGVGKIVVKDFHRTGYNLIPQLLDRRLRLVSGYYTGPAMGYGDLHGAQFALFVGLHASGGNEKGFLSHTLTSRIREIRLNGERIFEAQLSATVLSAFGVPLAFFSGCPEACREVEQKMDWVITCGIDKDPRIYGDEEKRPGYILHQRRKLQEKVREISRLQNLPLYALKPPFDCQVTFPSEAQAERRNPWGFLREGATLRFQTGRFLELYENLLKIAYFPRFTYPFRSLVIPLTRLVWKIQSLRHL